MAKLPGEVLIDTYDNDARVSAHNDRSSAYFDAKADTEYLTNVQELQVKLDEEADASNLPAYATALGAANSARASVIDDPIDREKWIDRSALDTDAVIAAKASQLSMREEIVTADARLEQIKKLALERNGDGAIGLIDAGARLVDGLFSVGHIDAATAQAKKDDLRTSLAERWLSKRPPEEQVTLLEEVSLGSDTMPVDGHVSSGGLGKTDTLAAFIPPDRRPDLLLAAKKELARKAELQSVEHYGNIKQSLEDASQGRSALPPRSVIDDNVDVPPALKDVLLRKYDVAAENQHAFEAAQANLRNVEYVWSPGSAEDRKALSVFDGWTGVVSGIASADPQQKGVVVQRFATTGMLSDEVRNTLGAMMRSGDDRKIEFAMSTLDEMDRLNPNGVHETFDKEIARNLVAWQNRGEQTSAEFSRMLMRTSDPERTKARDAMQAQGREQASNVSDRAVLSVHADRNAPGSAVADADGHTTALHREAWNSLFVEGFVASEGNSQAATKYADRMIKAEWAPSPSNGGRLMLHAPETLPNWILPEIMGSRDWMKNQVEAAARLHAGAGIEESSPVHSLVALPTTGEDIAILKEGKPLSGDRRSPTWGLVYIDGRTGEPAMVPFSFDIDAASRRHAP